MPYDYRGPRRRAIRLHGYDYAQAGMYFVTICSFQNRHFFGEIINGEMVLNDFGKIVLAEWENLPTRWPHLELGVYQVMPNHFHAVLVVHRPVGMVLMNERVRATLAVAPTTANGTTANGTTANGTTARVAPTDNPAEAVPETQFRYMNVSMMNVNGTPKIRITKNAAFEQTVHNNKLPKRPDFRVRATLAVAPIALAPIAPTTAKETPQIQIIPFTKTQWATRPTLGQIIGAFKSRVETECLKWFKQNHPGERMGKIWHRSYYDIIIRDAIAFRNITWYIINNPKNWRKVKFFTTH